MTRIRFHQLDELKHRILAMAGMAEQAIDLAVQAYMQRDLALCERVIANESDHQSRRARSGRIGHRSARYAAANGHRFALYPGGHQDQRRS
jgi:hypothetical protein